MQRVLEQRQWPFSRNYAVSIGPDGRVDYWVKTDRGDGGCAVLVVDDTEEAVAELRATIEVLDHSGRRYEAVAVVAAEELDAAHAALVRDAVGHEPLTASDPLEVVDAALDAAMARLDGRAARHPYSDLPRRIARIDRQQVRTQEMVADVAGAIADLRIELQTSTRPSAAASSAGAASPRTPPQVRALFEQAFRELDEIGSTAAAISSVYALSAGREDELIALRQIRNRPDEPLRGLGAVALIKTVVVGLQEAVEGWFTSAPPPGRGFVVGPEQAGRLAMVCTRYEEAYEWLPTRELAGLRRLPRPPRLLGADSWDTRISATQVQLARLGSMVRDAAFGLFVT